jgi:hypothetical protein
MRSMRDGGKGFGRSLRWWGDKLVSVLFGYMASAH